MTTAPEPPVALAWTPVPPGSARRDVAWRLVRELAGSQIAIANPCPHCGGPHGPVMLVGDERAVSVAYSGALAIVALAAPPVTALGLDAEPADRDATGLPLGASATVRDWVRVEAVLKADGRGLRVDPSRVRIDAGDPERMTARVADADVLYRVVDLAGPAGHVVSAAFASA